MRWSVLIVSAFLSACAGGGSSEIVRLATPDLEEYGPEFQERMADELDALPGDECPRAGRMPAGCSALLTFTLDAVRLRDQLRLH